MPPELSLLARRTKQAGKNLQVQIPQSKRGSIVEVSDQGIATPMPSNGGNNNNSNNSQHNNGGGNNGMMAYNPSMMSHQHATAAIAGGGGAGGSMNGGSGTGTMDPYTQMMILRATQLRSLMPSQSSYGMHGAPILHPSMFASLFGSNGPLSAGLSGASMAAALANSASIPVTPGTGKVDAAKVT